MHNDSQSTNNETKNVTLLPRVFYESDFQDGTGNATQNAHSRNQNESGEDTSATNKTIGSYLVITPLTPNASTIWQKIGLTPAITGLSIIFIIFGYFVWSGNQGEHAYMFLTILLAGFGNLGAGFILSNVQNWRVFIRVSELLVLEPTLLGLKGNIEMCMAARLSTQANLGNMDSWKSTFKMVRGNLSLDLAQATTVATVASIGVVVFSLIQRMSAGVNPLAEPFDFLYTLSIVLSSCLITACTASVLLGKSICSSDCNNYDNESILGSLLVTIIITSYRLKMNPDNIGSPVAASLGDVITLSLLAGYASVMFENTPPSFPPFPVLPVTVISCLLSLLPIWFVIAWKNDFTRPSVFSGWIPIFIAVLLSTCSGFLLDYASSDFVRYAIFQPVMNGIGGNLVAIHSSRMSTTLHKSGSLGELPDGTTMFRSPFRAFFDKADANIEMARNLLLMAIPAHIVYLVVTVVLKENIVLTLPFILMYISAAILQVSRQMVQMIRKRWILRFLSTMTIVGQ